MAKDKLAASVGLRIRQVRKEKLKMAQAEVAAQLGISHATISHWERGGNAKPANLREFARLSGVTMDYLINGNHAVAAGFHPRWVVIERRLVTTVPKDDLEAVFDEFDRVLDMRDRWIEGRQTKGKKGR